LCSAPALTAGPTVQATGGMRSMLPQRFPVPSHLYRLRCTHRGCYQQPCKLKQSSLFDMSYETSAQHCNRRIL